MIAAALCALALILGLCFRSPKEPPLDEEVIKRVRRFADQMQREQLLPYE